MMRKRVVLPPAVGAEDGQHLARPDLQGDGELEGAATHDTVEDEPAHRVSTWFWAPVRRPAGRSGWTRARNSASSA